MEDETAQRKKLSSTVFLNIQLSSEQELTERFLKILAAYTRSEIVAILTNQAGKTHSGWGIG